MSQASKQIKWCLNKADKEIEECKKLGKRIKHRGLVKSEPDVEEANKHIAKAIHNFNAITRFGDIGFSDWSISAGFYCIYQCFLAIARKFGYESRNQSCTVALIENLKEENKISIEQKFIDMLKYQDIEEIQEDSIIDLRENYTYGVELSVKEKVKIDELIKTCQEIIDATKEIVIH